MVSPHYLKYTHDLSDEAVLSGWVENPYWQYLSGMEYYEFGCKVALAASPKGGWVLAAKALETTPTMATLSKARWIGSSR